MVGKLLRVAVMLTVLGGLSCAYGPLAPEPEAEPVIALCRDRTIQTKPFEHSTVSIGDSEDIVARIDPALVRFERFERAGHGVWVDDEARAFTVLADFIRSG